MSGSPHDSTSAAHASTLKLIIHDFHDLGSDSRICFKLKQNTNWGDPIKLVSVERFQVALEPTRRLGSATRMPVWLTLNLRLPMGLAAPARGPRAARPGPGHGTPDVNRGWGWTPDSGKSGVGVGVDPRSPANRGWDPHPRSPANRGRGWGWGSGVPCPARGPDESKQSISGSVTVR